MILKKNNNLKIKNPADNFFNYLHIGEGMQFWPSELLSEDALSICEGRDAFP